MVQCKRDTVSEGESVAVVEGERVVVEGEVQRVEERDGGIAVEMKESHSTVVEFWSNGLSTSLRRWKGSDALGKKIQVSDDAKLLYE